MAMMMAEKIPLPILQLDHAMALLEDHSYAQVVKLTGISKSTLIRERKSFSTVFTSLHTYELLVLYIAYLQNKHNSQTNICNYFVSIIQILIAVFSTLACTETRSDPVRASEALLPYDSKNQLISTPAAAQ